MILNENSAPPPNSLGLLLALITNLSTTYLQTPSILPPKQTQSHQLNTSSIPNKSSDANYLVDLFNKIFVYKSEVSLLQFDQKLKLTKIMYKVLRNMLDTQVRSKMNEQILRIIIRNVMNTVCYSQEILLINLCGYHYIEFIDHANLDLYIQSVDLINKHLFKIKEKDREKLIYLDFPDFEIYDNAQNRSYRCLIFHLLSSINESKQNEHYQLFLLELAKSRQHCSDNILLKLLKLCFVSKTPLKRINQILSNDCLDNCSDIIITWISQIIVLANKNSKKQKEKEKSKKKKNQINQELIDLIPNIIRMYYKDKRAQKIIQSLFILFLYSQSKDLFNKLVSKWTCENNHIIYYLSSLIVNSNNPPVSHQKVQHFKVIVDSLQMFNLRPYAHYLFEIAGKYFNLIKRRFSEIKKNIPKLTQSQQNQSNHFIIAKGYQSMMEFFLIVRRLIESILKQEKSKKHEQELKIIESNLKVSQISLFKLSFIYLIQTTQLINSSQQQNFPQITWIHKNLMIFQKYLEIESAHWAQQFLVSSILSIMTLKHSSLRKLQLSKQIIWLLFQFCQIKFSSQDSQINSVLLSKDNLNKKFVAEVLLYYVNKHFQTDKTYDTLAEIIVLLIKSIRRKFLQENQDTEKLMHEMYFLPPILQQKVIQRFEDQLLAESKKVFETHGLDQQTNFFFLQFYNAYHSLSVHKIKKNQNCYIRFYEFTSTLLSNLSKLPYYQHYEDNPSCLTRIQQQLNLALNSQDKYPPYSMFGFLEKSFDFQQSNFTDYINIVAKLIHLIATHNVDADKKLDNSFECQFEEFCIKSCHIISKIKKLNKLSQKFLFSKRYRVIGPNQLNFTWNIVEFKNQVSMSDLKKVILSLNTIIYYCQQLTPQSLRTLISIKITLALYLEPLKKQGKRKKDDQYQHDKSYCNLPLDSKMRVLSQMLPIARTNKQFYKWMQNQINNQIRLDEIKGCNQNVTYFYSNAKVFFTPKDKIDQSHFESHQYEDQNDKKIRLLKYYVWDHNSTQLAEEILQTLMVSMIDGSGNGTYQQSLNLSLFKHNKVNQYKMSKQIKDDKIDKVDASVYYKHIFPYWQLFDFNVTLSHMYSDYFVRVVQLLARKNQLTQMSNISQFGARVCFKCYNFKGALAVINSSLISTPFFNQIYAVKQKSRIDISKVFDSLARIFQQYQIVDMDELEKLRSLLFDKRKSRMGYLDIDSLVANLQDVFYSKISYEYHPLNQMFSFFIQTIMRYWGKSNKVDSFVLACKIKQATQIKDFRYNDIYQSRKKNKQLEFQQNLQAISVSLVKHLQGQTPLDKQQFTTYKQSLINLYYQQINNNYLKAMNYYHVLGKLHQDSNNTLLTQNQIFILSYISTQFNYSYKQRILMESDQRQYLRNAQSKYHQILHNDTKFKIEQVNNLDAMLALIKRTQYPLVSIFNFGNQTVTLIVTDKIQASYTKIEDFMDIYCSFQNCINECNNIATNIESQMGNSKQLSYQSKQWWQNRNKADKRMQILVNTMSKFESINFMNVLYGGRDQEYQNQVQYRLEETGAIRSHQKSKTKFGGNDLKQYFEDKDKDQQTLDTMPPEQCNTVLSMSQSSQSSVVKQSPNIPTNRITAKKLQLILHLEQSLQNFPYQYLNHLSSITKGIYRIPSISYFLRQACSSRKSINMANLSYLVNPLNNLDATQQRFINFKKQYSTWKGLVGQKPDPQQFLNLLQKDVFLYMGHGNGKYVSDLDLFKKQPKTVPLLYGCSSARMVEEGYEANGFCLTYLLSGCPLLLGCLWSITDKDIDDFTERMIDIYKDDIVDVGHTVCWSRRECKMKYLNGGAIVLYGLPHLFTYDSEEVIG